MSRLTTALGTFVLRTLLWLPPCLAGLALERASDHAASPAAWPRLLLNLLRPGIVSAVEQSQADLAFVTTIQMSPPPQVRSACWFPEVNPLLYTYGLAFFLALMLAARARWWTIPAGIALLLPFQGWGIAFDFLAQVGIKLGAHRCGPGRPRRLARGGHRDRLPDRHVDPAQPRTGRPLGRLQPPLHRGAAAVAGARRPHPPLAGSAA